jgi:hypothetical protein
MVCAEPFKERRTRLIQRTFKGMRTIGTRSAQDIRASGLTYRINRPDTAPVQCCKTFESSCQDTVHT